MKSRSRPKAAPENLGEKFNSIVEDAPAEWVALADLALAGNGVAEGSVNGGRVIAVSDLVLALAPTKLPKASTLIRADGRTVSFFALPGGGR